MDIFVARQPIFDRNREVFAYELLYRDSDKNSFNADVSSNVATSVLLMNSYLNFGIEHLVGDKKSFVNFDAHLVLNDIPHLLDQDKVVIELLEDIVPTPSFMNKVKMLKNKGYTLAIDDFIEDYQYTDLVELCDIIKVEFMGATKESIKRIVNTWKPKGKLLLAEKVETIEEFKWAQDNGFDYFQGYFFSKPTMMKSKTLKDNAIQYVRLMNEMNVIEPNYKHIASIIETDVSSTYMILKLVNSKLSPGNKVHSIQHALSILGIKTIRRWLSLAMVQNLSTPETYELVVTSMIRSHLLENIATHSNLEKYDQELTLIGILSIIDTMLEKPMAELLASLPLADEVKRTLLSEETILSPAFNLCLSYEKGDFDKINEYTSTLDYNAQLLPRHYVDAVKWSDDTFAFMLHNDVDEYNPLQL